MISEVSAGELVLCSVVPDMRAGPGFFAVHSPLPNFNLWSARAVPTVSFFFKFTFYFMCKGTLPECISGHHVYAVPAETRRGCLSSGTGVTADCELP